MTIVDEFQIEQDANAVWDRDADLRREFANDFEAYIAYCKADAASQVRRAAPSTERE